MDTVEQNKTLNEVLHENLRFKHDTDPFIVQP